jgi:hypothetical protein
MPEPLSDKRRAEIDALPKTIRRHGWTAAEDAITAIRDLSKEADRLTALLTAEQLASEAAETENDRLRIQLGNSDDIIRNQVAEIRRHREWAAVSALEAQYASRDTDGIIRRVTEWQATRAREWAPCFELIARPVRPVGDWERAEPPAQVDLPDGPDEPTKPFDVRQWAGAWSPDGGAATTALSATETAEQDAAVHRDVSNVRMAAGEAREATG